MDNLTKEQRRRNMRAIRSKDTGIELLLRKELFKRGYRYRTHYAGVVGKPDIVFVSAKIAIFCDSEFWHGKRWATTKHKIKSNKEYWHNKIESNIKRDKAINKLLRHDNWKVLRFWGKMIEKNLAECVNRIENEIKIRGYKIHK